MEALHRTRFVFEPEIEYHWPLIGHWKQAAHLKEQFTRKRQAAVHKSCKGQSNEKNKRRKTPSQCSPPMGR